MLILHFSEDSIIDLQTSGRVVNTEQTASKMLDPSKPPLY